MTIFWTRMKNVYEEAEAAASPVSDGVNWIASAGSYDEDGLFIDVSSREYQWDVPADVVFTGLSPGSLDPYGEQNFTFMLTTAAGYQPFNAVFVYDSYENTVPSYIGGGQVTSYSEGSWGHLQSVHFTPEPGNTATRYYVQADYPQTPS